MSSFEQLVLLCQKHGRFPRKEDQGTLVDYTSGLISTGFSELTDAEFDKLCEVSTEVESMISRIRGQFQVFTDVLEFCTENDRIPTPEDTDIWPKFREVWNRKRHSRGEQLDTLRKVSPQVKQQIRDYEKQLALSRNKVHDRTRLQVEKARKQLQQAMTLLEYATRTFESVRAKLENDSVPVPEPEVPVPAPEPVEEKEVSAPVEEVPKPKAKAKAKAKAKSRTKS